MNEEKEVLRKKIKEQRAQLSEEEINSISRVVVEQYCELSVYKETDILLTYLNTSVELNVSYLIEQCKEDGKRVAVPRILSSIKKGSKMEFVFLDFFMNDYTENLKKNSYQILEPMQGEILEAEYYRDKKLEMILPGLCFDFYGNRIGYGGGYFDRYLAEFPYPIHKTVLAFDFQVFDTLPWEETDKKFDMLVTEKRIFVL